MRNLLCALILFSGFTYGQEKGIPFEFTDVVKVDSVSSLELYNRGNVWFATTYKSSTDVIQLEDKEAGVIIGKAIMPFKPSISLAEKATGSVSYTVKLYFKEGRYKVEIVDFVHKPYSSSKDAITCGVITNAVDCPVPNAAEAINVKLAWIDLKKKTQELAEGLIQELNKEMLKPVESSSDDW